jgi:hypothetical protein
MQYFTPLTVTVSYDEEMDNYIIDFPSGFYLRLDQSEDGMHFNDFNFIFHHLYQITLDDEYRFGEEDETMDTFAVMVKSPTRINTGRYILNPVAIDWGADPTLVRLAIVYTLGEMKRVREMMRTVDIGDWVVEM